MNDGEKLEAAKSKKEKGNDYFKRRDEIEAEKERKWECCVVVVGSGVLLPRRASSATQARTRAQPSHSHPRRSLVMCLTAPPDSEPPSLAPTPHAPPPAVFHRGAQGGRQGGQEELLG